MAKQKTASPETGGDTIYASTGLRDASVPARPIPARVDDDGTPASNGLPPGYGPGRGVRIK